MHGSRNFRPGPSDIKKKSTNVVLLFFFVLSFFYRSQMVNFKENYHFPRFQMGSNIFQGGGGGVQLYPVGGPINCLYPIFSHITCDFPEWSRPPAPPPPPYTHLWIRPGRSTCHGPQNVKNIRNAPVVDTRQNC